MLGATSEARMANGWGGKRNGSGRKGPGAYDNVVPLKRGKQPPPRQPLFSDESIAAILDAVREQKLRARNRPRTPDWNPYIIRPDLFGPVQSHIKRHKPHLAMDQNEALNGQNMYAVQAWQAGGLLGNDAAEGLLFLGYPYLSELAQRAEFRLFGEIMSEEMTRKFIDFRGTDDESTKEKDKQADKNEEEDASAEGDEEPGPEAFDEALSEMRPGDRPDQPEPDREAPPEERKDKPRSDSRNKEIERKIIELRHFAEDIKLRQVFKTLAAHDSQFGIGHLFLDLKGANVDDPRDPENRLSIGNGRDEATKAKLGRNCLKGIRTIEPVWCYPTMYNAMNPLHPSWYDPEVWYVMGAEIHKTRLIPFIGRPVPDILKPAYAFGGLPMTQMAQPYVDIWLRTRESVSEIIHAFSIMILQTNMGTITQPGGAGGQAGDVIARMQLMNALRDNQGMMILDKATEDFKNVSAPLGTLDALQAQAQEHMYSIARIPAVKWTGIQPQGLNATSEGELRAFNDTIHGAQEHLFRVGLTTIVDIMQISLWGERDPDIVFEFEELHEMTEKEKAETRKIKAETDQIRVDSGIVSQEEVRTVLVSDPESEFHGLDPEDVPELLQEEEAGLIPPGAGKGLEAELAQGGGPQGAQGGGGGQPPPQAGPPFSGRPKPRKPPPFGGADMAMDKAADLAELRGPFESAKQADILGYLDGLNSIDVVPDKDQWHSEYFPESDTIEVQRKLLADRDPAKTRTILHEAGHRGQYRADKACFRAFEKAGLATTDHFVALANRVHLHDFRCKGHVEDKAGEVFAESYAHFCLGMEMPAPLMEFWRARQSDRITNADGRGAMPLDQAMDAEWDESKHPRDKSGKFGSGGGGGAAAKPKASHTGGPNATPQKPFAKIDTSKLSQTGGKMGSNEGGTFEDMDGKNQYYVKKPKSAAHVKNENAAARLYQLAGANTFEYLDAGPNHVATKMEKLPKKNVKDFTPAEKKLAQKDFAIHAWLANWDAVGLGGDNAGIDKDGNSKVLDVGGSMFYRAQGGPKGDAFGPKVNETATFLNAQQNPDSAAFYGDMTAAQKIESAKRVTEIPNDAIREIVEVSGYHEDVAKLLIQRKNDLAGQYGLVAAGDTNPEWEAQHPRGPGGKFAAKPGGPEEEESEFEGMEPEDYEQFQTLVGDLEMKKDWQGMKDLGAQYPEFALEMAKTTLNDNVADYLEQGVKQAQAGSGEPDFLPANQKEFNTTLMEMNQKNDTAGMQKLAAENPEFAKGILQTVENPKIKHHVEQGLAKTGPLETMAAAPSAAAWEPKPPESFKTKKELIGHLLSNPEGVTMADVLKQTGWPSVSMPAQAATAGMKLEKKKVGGETKYFGTPMTVEEKALSKAKIKTAVAAAAPAAPAAPAKPEPPKAPEPKPAATAVKHTDVHPPPTEAELNKAKKSQPLQMSYVPGEKPSIAGSEYSKKAEQLLKEFNDTYSGKDLTSKEALTVKVSDFKTLGKQIGALAAEENANKAAIQKKANEEAQAHAAKLLAEKKAAEAAEKKKFAEQHAAVSKELGITHPDHLVAFDAFIDHFGGAKSAMEKFKTWQTKAQNAAKNHPGHGYEKLNGFEMGCIAAYTGPQSDWINSAIRDDIMTPAQHMFESVLNSALDKLPKANNKITRRGLTLDAKVLSKLKPGMVWNHRNFASSNEKGWGGNTKLHISCTGKGGAYVAPISSHQGEGETLFKSNLKLYIDKIEVKDGVTNVHCKEV